LSENALLIVLSSFLYIANAADREAARRSSQVAPRGEPGEGGVIETSFAQQPELCNDVHDECFVMCG
jgi:hypothetical protein